MRVIVRSILYTDIIHTIAGSACDLHKLSIVDISQDKLSIGHTTRHCPRIELVKLPIYFDLLCGE